MTAFVIKETPLTTALTDMTDEGFRQWALLIIKDKLNKKVADSKTWKINHKNIRILFGNITIWIYFYN